MNIRLFIVFKMIGEIGGIYGNKSVISFDIVY